MTAGAGRNDRATSLVQGFEPLVQSAGSRLPVLLRSETLMFAKRTDSNQREIVAALRKAGCSVQDLSRIGQGCPDLLASRAGVNYLLEAKVGQRGKLNKRQKTWHLTWRGHVSVVRTAAEALRAVGLC